MSIGHDIENRAPRKLTKLALRLTVALLMALLLAACGPDDNGPGGGGGGGDDDDDLPPAGEVRLLPVVDGLEAPAAIAGAGDGRLFVVERAGTVRIVADGALLPTPFIDLSGQVKSDAGEQGLVGMAFDPDYAANGLFYLYYTASDGRGVLSRFSVMAGDPNQADPASEEELARLEEPAEYHNGGQLGFGPDGYLYWAVGDGGEGTAAQDLGSLRGKILRLDVSAPTGYAVPPTNPFVGQAGARGEVWAYGLRNPWRFSFDPATGDLYIADVGEDEFEEVNRQPAASDGGENYGWPTMEAEDCFGATTCDRTGLTLPTLSYPHPDDGASISGGYVYRGSDLPELEGLYVFGDFMNGRIWTAGAADGWSRRTLLQTEAMITTFGEDADGELYVADYVSGTLYRLGR